MVKRSETPISLVAGLALAMFWIGLLIGVSFLATPAKFLAPSLSLPIALDIGRHTFAIFNKVEWPLAVALLLVSLFQPRQGIATAGCVLAAFLVTLEAAWLLPVLDQRVGLIIAGGQPPQSNLHNLYIGIEVAKLMALAVVAFAMARRLSHVDAVETVGTILQTTSPTSLR